MESSASPPNGGLKRPVISVRGLTFAGGAIGLAAMTWTFVLSRVVEGYGSSWLDVMASVYPGFQNNGGVLDFVVGALYAIVHFGTGGYLIAKIHNEIADIEVDHDWFRCWPCTVRQLKHIIIWPVLLFKKHDH